MEVETIELEKPIEEPKPLWLSRMHTCANTVRQLCPDRLYDYEIKGLKAFFYVNPSR